MGKARIIIKEGIEETEVDKVIKLMDPDNIEIIRTRVENAVTAILKGTEYERTKGNPPVFGVEKET